MPLRTQDNMAQQSTQGSVGKNMRT